MRYLRNDLIVLEIGYFYTRMLTYWKYTIIHVERNQSIAQQKNERLGCNELIEFAQSLEYVV
jgi:hypothetical protein